MDKNKIEEIKNIIGPLRVYENEPLSKHAYFKIGGPAKLFFEAKNSEDFILALKTAHQLKIPFVVLGAGANVLVSDTGFDGFVIKNRTDGVKLVGIKGTLGKNGTGINGALVWAASGTLMNRLARFTIDQGLEGLEFLLSVPGTIGGGLKINSHYEVEKNEFIGNTLATATVFDPKTGETKKVGKDYFEFAYDYSKIQETGEIIIDATFKVESSKKQESLWQKAMDDVKRRNLEQPIGEACSGCIFQNISIEDAQRLSTPNLTTSTGYIIEKLGLKGKKIGGAEVSTRHANYILNTNESSAENVIDLINLIKDKAKKEYNLDLKEEIFYIGDFSRRYR